MSEFIKIDENTIEEVIRRRIDISKLRRRLKEIDKEMREIKPVESNPRYPEDVQRAINFYNESVYGAQLASLESEKNQIIRALRKYGVKI